MRERIDTCVSCGNLEQIHARGMGSRCYTKWVRDQGGHVVDVIVDTSHKETGPFDTSWHHRGTCAQMGPAVWDMLDHDDQKRTCHDCPMLDRCLDFGSTIEAHGVVYGGRMFRRGKPGLPLREHELVRSAS